jgi:cell pole-organizing protein PopZ
MNKPDKVGEPSMDEILASIRKIIAEEPSDAKADFEGAANPLLTGTELRHDRSDKPLNLNDRPRPSLDRLSNALKARAAAPPPAPQPSARRPSPFSMEPPSSFDDDLADLLEAPTASSIFSEGRPRLAPKTEAGDAMLSPAAAPEAGEAAAEVDAAIDEAISALPPDGDTPAPIELAALNGKTFEAAHSATPSVPPPPATPPLVSPWESMRRKNGFWPPQNATASPPAATPTAASDASVSPSVNGTAFPGSGPFPSKEAQQARNAAAAPSATADLIARLHAGLSEPASAPEPAPLPPSSPPPSSPPMQFGAPLGASAPSPPAPHAPAPHVNGTGYAPPSAGPNGFVPPYSAAPYPAAPYPATPIPAARPAEPAPLPPTPALDPYARPLSADAMMGAALAQLISGGAPLSNAADPFARSQPAGDMGGRYQDPYAQNYPAPGPDPAAAAAAAFDALALGLAGSPRPEPRRPYDHQPVANTAHTAHTALVAQPLLPAVQDYHPQAIRTLEDAVADMLKPMLQKWLSDNMPRIIERALRVEAASGMKPPGSS